MQIRAEEISQIIRQQVEQYDQKVAVVETGTVLTADALPNAHLSAQSLKTFLSTKLLNCSLSCAGWI